MPSAPRCDLMSLKLRDAGPSISFCGMPWKPPSECDSAIARDFKQIAAAIIAARAILDPRDRNQGPVWTMLDNAEARLQGLASVIRE